METPYGTPSAPISVADAAGRRLPFLPRHGPRHPIPAPFVNSRANVWAMHELGVRRIIGPSAVGSLQPDLHPGDLVICDQFIDRTSGRSDTYYPGPEVVTSVPPTHTVPSCARLPPASPNCGRCASVPTALS